MLEHIAWISLVTALTCALIIAIDEFRHPQKMWIMNIVWPPNGTLLQRFRIVGTFQSRTKNEQN